MKFLERTNDPQKNLLPHNGEAFYHGRIFNDSESRRYFTHFFEEIEWQHDQLKIFGKNITTKRKVAWYGEQEFSYRYSGTTKIALPWTKTLLELKAMVESISSASYNSCLLNLYHAGDEGMAWHSDNEPELQKNGSIASISLGAERKFSFKHKQSGEKVELWLEDGSLLIMQEETQTHWLHRLPPTKKVTSPRINLTFRQVNPDLIN